MSDAQNKAEQIRSYVLNDLLHGQPVGYCDDLLMTGLIDSMAVMYLVAAVEEISGMSIPPADVTLDNFVSIDAMMNYLKTRV